MAGYTRTERFEDDELAVLVAPRDDVVQERAIGPADGSENGDGVHRFEQAEGPFLRYERRVETLDDGRSRETVDFLLPPGTWRWLIDRAMRSTLRRPPRPGGKMPWWAPTQRLEPRAAQVLGLCAALAMVTGYVGTLLSQTMTFAADEFRISDSTQSDVLAFARLGGVLAVALTALADRRGRRRLLRVSLLGCILSDALAAVTPNLAGLALSQVVNRGAWAAAAILLGIVVAEEMPAGARAYAVSLLSMTGALGAGMALWVLPVADVGLRAWRILYVVPLVMLPLVVRACRRLPESRRFEHAHLDLSMKGHLGRLALLAGSAFLLNVFIAPVTQLRPEFLRDDRGFSAAGLSLFALLTSTPAGLGIIVGGRLADTVGRRVVGAVATAVGTVLIALQFGVTGPAMWAAATVGAIIFAAHVPSVTVYGPELFPTSLRGRANGIISITAMAGSVVGLVAAGRLVDRLDSLGTTMILLAAAPLVMALLIAVRYPETVRRELEDINPDDKSPPIATLSPLAGTGAPADSG